MGFFERKKCRSKKLDVPELRYKRQKNLQEIQTEMWVDVEVREAVICGNFAQFALFLTHFSQMITSKNSEGVGLLHLTAAHGHEIIFLFLASNGLPVTDVSLDKSTLLHWAARGGNCIIVSYLLSAGLLRHMVTATGCTPYALAQLHNHAEAARLRDPTSDAVLLPAIER